MALLLNQPSKLLCFRREPVLVRSSPLLSNNGLSSSLLQTPPCTIIDADPCGAGLGKLVISNANGLCFTHLEKKVPMELVDNPMLTIGSSHGWIATLSQDDGILRLQDDLNPCFFYSKKDDMFRIPGSGGHLIGSWDLGTYMHTPKIQKLRFKKFPKLAKTTRKLLDSCCTSEHLVESCSTGGDIFLVKWYKRTAEIINGVAKMQTEALMVFKLDEQGNALYTQDTGDLKPL